MKINCHYLLITFHYLLPFLFLDILFCIGSDGKPVIIPEKMKNKIVFNDFDKPPELGKWFAMMIFSRNSVLFNSNEYTGLTSCKIRQLKKIGYEPIVVRIVVCYANMYYYFYFTGQ